MAPQDDDIARLQHAMHNDPQLAAMRTPTAQHLRQRLRQRQQRRAGLAASLLLTLTLGGGMGWQASQWLSPAQGQPMDDAVQSWKLVNGVAPVRYDINTTQASELATWLRLRFNPGEFPPDLQPYGYQLQGGRLMATNQGPAALVVYQNTQGEKIMWYIRPGEITRLPRGERQDGTAKTRYWSDQHYNYALVSQGDVL